jgi:quinol monooxygenase YgiN
MAAKDLQMPNEGLKTGLRRYKDEVMMPLMNAKSLTAVAHVKAKPGKESDVRRELLSLVAPSRKDEGCLNYDLHQGVDNPALFLFHENWTSKAHLDRHLQKPDLRAVLARVGQMVAEPPQITLWERISE